MNEAPEFPLVAAPLWAEIPQSLATRQQWVLWKFEHKEGAKKPQKMPYYVGGGKRAGEQGSDRDRQRLATLPVVRKRFEAGGWTGVGLAFLPDDGLIGIDLDGQQEPDGSWSDRCKNIVGACDSFTEISPSGKGVHIIVEGSTKTNKDNGIGVEVFCGSQYFTITANRFPNTPAEVQPIDEIALRRLHKTIDDAKAAAKAAKQAPPKPARTSPAAQPAGEGVDDFQRVKEAAMANFGAWVPVLFPSAVAVGSKYRITSKSLGRDLQEDLSIAPEGICDFGVADMGDPKQGARTPIDLVMEWLPAEKPADALKWLAPLVGVELTKPKRAGKNQNRDPEARAGGQGGGGEGPPPGAVPPLDDDDGEAYDIVMSKLVKGRGGRPDDCRENVLYCMLNDPALRGLIKKNDFSQLLERSKDAPWGRPAGEWDDEDDLMLGEYLLRRFGLGIKGKGTLRDGVLMAARLSKYNPIVDWIHAEKWDEVPRIDHWLADVFEVEDRPYTRLIGRCFMMGLVKRAIQPGCKFDYMLILKGEQGLSKSGAFRALAYPYFTDNAIRIGDKDSQMAMQLAWIVESAELESLNKSETTLIKQFLSAQEDWYRPPYGSQMVKQPRHSVNVGTTNADTFLKDATGDRRFWPLEVKVVHLDILTQQRSQLLAEALHRLNEGEQYWPTRQEEKDLVFPEQEPFKRSDPWEDNLDEYVNADHGTLATDVPRRDREFFPSTELYDKALNIKADRIDGNGQMDTRIVNCMRQLGFKRHRETTGKRRRGYLRLPPATPVQTPAQAGMPPDDHEEGDDLPF
ncbi:MULTISPECIES: VapE domain-containing protein [unclassified Variovorax]|uniref:VapE domain-containing protein n=1 Tax=unclassified Variovorax TaxID=663243 RepID=UPI002578D20C|nr:MULTISPECIES: VapE domain-containing protein [unclassified Variovorax]MDM0086764.1 VapE family protein [Variovorax sp. J22G40]MDM0144980.1 VapE family protein [Variovorax sp. J2P1-31]